jgi:hypothetical protein
MTLNLDTLTLAKGGHRPGDTMCLLEAVAFQAGEPWSDRPACVSPVLATFGRNLNDVLPDDTRQRLVPFVPRLLNTAGDGLDERRSYMALDWLVRTYLPTWLRLVPALCEKADLLAAAHEVRDLDSAAAIGVIVREAASEADAARAATGAATGAAAWAAAGAATGAAARAATGAAAWDATGVAARAAAWTAARAAARDALAPTVTALQNSAIDLFDRMVEAT